MAPCRAISGPAAGREFAAWPGQRAGPGPQDPVLPDSCWQTGWGRWSRCAYRRGASRHDGRRPGGTGWSVWRTMDVCRTAPCAFLASECTVTGQAPRTNITMYRASTNQACLAAMTGKDMTRITGRVPHTGSVGPLLAPECTHLQATPCAVIQPSAGGASDAQGRLALIRGPSQRVTRCGSFFHNSMRRW